MSNVKKQFLEHYLERCKEVPIMNVLQEIYDRHFIEKPVVKNYDNFIDLKSPISKLEAIQFDIEKYEEEYVILLCNKLIPKINGIVMANHKEILEKSKSQYPFEVFAWKALDDEFIDAKKELREKAIQKLTEIYRNEEIEISIVCVPMNPIQHLPSGYFRRISFRFL